MRPLITVAELAGRSDQVTLLDIRWHLGGPSTWPEYLAGHIPGAVWADLETDFADPPGSGGRHPLPDPGRLQQRLRALGMSDDRATVVYDAADSTAAARAWWVLRWAGLAEVQVLDGGLAAWQAAGLPLEPGSAIQKPGNVTVRPGAMSTVDAAGAGRLGRKGILLDARAAARYRGESEPIDSVAGHIPGARSAPTATNVGGDGTFLPRDELIRRYEDLGVRNGDDVAAYCGSGVTAAHTVLALELVGTAAALYPGSWSEWITDPARPVATGDEPPSDRPR